MCALFGIWKSQYAYVPLDHSLPIKRMKYILNESKPAYIITTVDDLNEQVMEACAEANVPVLLYDGLLKQECDQTECSVLGNKQPDPLLAVLYTSGSSGKPKGVKIRTANLVNRLNWQWELMPPQETDVGCHKTSLLFVDSLTEILSSLLKGVSVVIPPSGSQFNVELLLETIQRYRVTHLVLVPTLLKMIIAYISTNDEARYMLGNVHHLVSSGEILSPDLATQCIGILSKGSTLWNFYGSTETTGDTTYEKFTCLAEIRTKTVNGCLSIGKPIYNATILLLDESDNVVHEGEVGEVCVLGDPVADGYIGGEASDSFKFWNRDDGSTSILYLTGDLGMMSPKGLILLGRKDTVIKIRGQRINLKEVDTVLTATNLVKESVTQNIHSEKSDKYDVVCLYTEVHNDSTDNHKEMLEDKLKQHLTCMLPSFVTVNLCLVDEMPKLPSGKVDMQALKDIWHLKCKEREKKRFRMNTINIIDIIANNLDVNPNEINADSTLVDIGMNSFSMTMIAVDLIKAGYEIKFGDVISCKTIGEVIELANRCQNDTDEKDGEDQGNKNTISIDSKEYQVKSVSSLSKEKQDALIIMMSKSFTAKNPLDVMAGTKVEEFEKFLQGFWEETLSDDLSFCIENSKGEILAASISLDIKTEMEPQHTFDHVLQINVDVEKPIRDSVLASGERWVDSLLSAADVTLDDDVALALMMELEKELLRIAKERGYHGIITVNSHPVTMVNIV